MSVRNFDIRSYLDHLSIPQYDYGESKSTSRGWINIPCIYCGDDKDHLGIHLVYKNFHCWKCDERGNLLTLIQDFEDINYGAALRRLEEFEDEFAEEIEPEAPQRKSRDSTSLLPTGCTPDLTHTQKSYLIRRRFDPSHLSREWGILSGPRVGPWRDRIIIPVSIKREMVTWIGLDPTGRRVPKYRAAAEEESYLPTSEVLYGYDKVKHNVLVVEGVTDVWRIGPGAVALLGMTSRRKDNPSTIAQHKLHQLLSLEADNYYIMLDAEKTAQRHAVAIAKQLRFYRRYAEIIELDRGDPDDLLDSEVSSLRAELEIDS